MLAALPSGRMAGCAFEGPTHNSYMFSVFRRDAITGGPAYLADINAYWIEYCKGKVKPQPEDLYGNCFFSNHYDDILKTAQAKGDNAMVAYLKLLNRYISVCELFTEDGWNYPTKAQVASRKQKAQAILAAAKLYKGTGLRQQYTLLQMRLNMILGLNTANTAIWNNTANKFVKTCWRDAMQNIYARALFKSGKRLEACDEYAKTGDMKSIKTVMGKYRNLAGIKAVYQQNPNSPSLNFLVQDFVNNVQETIDQKPKTKDDEEWLKTIDSRCIYRNEAMQFVEFATKAANEGKTKHPCLWLTAAGMVNYLFGNQQQALAETTAALNAPGTARMRDNARAIRLLVSTKDAKIDDSFTDYVLKEMKWLDSKIATERTDPSEYSNHYTDVKDRVVHKALEPLFRKNGKPFTAIAMCDMMQNTEKRFDSLVFKEDQREGYNKYQTMQHWPWDEVVTQLDSLKADQLSGYYKYITSTPSNALEQYCTTQTFKDEQFFNDLIGTKYMAEGRFAEAIPYLSRLTEEFMSNQSISVYEANRNYGIERWFKHQKTIDDDYGIYAKVTDNKKLDFCKEMLNLQSQLKLARNGQPLEETAYKLAVRYFQASCYGDCWWLTHHYKSVNDSARTWELDYTKETVKYLDICKKSSNLKTRYKALYALAFIPTDPWYVTTYDKDWNELLLIKPESAQYKALAELNDFATSHPDEIDDYTKKCDILAKFLNR